MHGINYSLSLPVGETRDYINSFSWRGVNIEGKYFLNDNMTLGWSGGWNVLYKSESGEFTDGTRTRTGTQYRYLNSIPFLLTFDYFLNEDGEIQPYLGVGMGTYWIEQKTTMGLFSSTTDNWHFGLAPEVGVIIPVNIQSNFYVSLRYNNAFAANESINYGYLGFNVGFLWY
jgi:outer membrane protein W